MRHFLTAVFAFIIGGCFAQNTNSKVIAFPITDYIIKTNDTIQIVQLQLPDGLSIKERTVGILKSKHIKGDKDLQEIGYGRCYLIKGDYYYFSVTMKKGNRLPSAGDLLYTTIDLPGTYDGLLYKVARHCITFSKIDETPLMRLKDALLTSDEAAESILLDLFVEEVKYTGTTMLAQNDNQNMVIDKGTYKDQKLFTLMQGIHQKDIKDFLEYIVARPAIYSGKNWKFAEIFATWTTEGAPTVIKD